MVFSALPFAQTDLSPVETWVERQRQFHARVRATPTTRLRDLFLSRARREPRLVDEVRWVRGVDARVAPFLPGRSPDAWPARDLGGAGRRFLLLFDMHVSGL
jgi:hypothetical protein